MKINMTETQVKMCIAALRSCRDIATEFGDQGRALASDMVQDYLNSQLPESVPEPVEGLGGLTGLPELATARVGARAGQRFRRT